MFLKACSNMIYALFGSNDQELCAACRLDPVEISLHLRARERIKDPLDRRCASFETAASQLPQDEGFS
jgi:hypothetical protein